MRSIRFLAACLLIAWFAGTAQAADEACPPQATLPPATQMQQLLKTAQDHGFLWRISKDGHSSYLYGTLHLGRLEWAFPGKTVRQALDATDQLALELDLTDATTNQQLSDAMRGGAALELPEALRQRLARQIAAACLPAAPLTSLHPLMQAMTVTALAGRRDGLDPTFGQELVLAGFAHARQRPIAALESVDLQMQALLPSDETEAREALEHMLQQLEGGQVRPLLRHIGQVWEQGRLDELEQYEQWCDCANTPEERAQLKRLNDERNPHLADGIDALHRQGRQVFAAVGALHMTGPQGLPRLMAARGYTVERVPFPH